ncbi:MAG: NAD-dependent epimerase/dehydratase family protein [Betaproteobacteria bacterium]|nr:NAD-dependent epimerase/dehydratase family protein [Betaproteobacteria bacterium]
MARVVVTGASGFVGRTLLPALSMRGHEVVALDRTAIGDIAEARDWGRLLAGADTAIHLAALAHAHGASEARLRAVNVDASVAIGKAAAGAGVHMVFLSSVKALGEDTGAAPLDDASPLAPHDAYGSAKAEAERALRAIERLKLTVLRPPLVYGPGVKANFLALLRALERGWPLPLASVANRRSVVFVGNLVDAIVRCLESPKAVGKSYVVSDGVPVSTPELARAIAASLGRPARLLPFPPRLLELAGTLVGQGEAVRRLTRSLEVDDRAIRRELGWQPPFTFEEGIRLTAQWFRDEGAMKDS